MALNMNQNSAKNLVKRNEGGGPSISYSKDHRSVQGMFSKIAPRYDLLNTVLSFGIHHLWQKRAFALLPETEEWSVLDLCTGTGALIEPLTRRFKRVIGADFALPMLQAGKAKGVSPKAILCQADALNLPFESGVFDLVTVAYGVRNFEDLQSGLAEIHRVLRPGGSLLILEFGQPTNWLWRWVYGFYSRCVLPVLGGAISGEKQAYSYLQKTASQFPCGPAFEEILSQAGIKPLQTKALNVGIAFAYLGVRDGVA